MSGMRRRREPLFMGQPSPSLARINRMTPDQLNQRIQSLEVEASRIAEKIKNLSNMTPKDEARIALLNSQKARLAALQQVARDRLAGKPPFVDPRDQQPRDRGNIRTYRDTPRRDFGSGPGGSRPFGGGGRYRPR